MHAGMDITISGLPFSPAPPGTDAWLVDSETSVTGDAGPRTDLFVDPATGQATRNAPRLLTPAPAGDFQLSAEVAAFHEATFDAGALVVWAGDGAWAKLAFEYSPQATGMVVSVVTRGLSDDANGYTIDGLWVWLRISRVGRTFAFHASRDGATWDFIRHFSLDGDDIAVGFEVQSPMGEGCRARFTHIAFTPTTVTDLRDGS
jgi:regulation of enolase protein 1 (concanavalin A-like superfamily)